MTHSGHFMMLDFARSVGAMRRRLTAVRERTVAPEARPDLVLGLQLHDPSFFGVWMQDV